MRMAECGSGRNGESRIHHCLPSKLRGVLHVCCVITIICGNIMIAACWRTQADTGLYGSQAVVKAGYSFRQRHQQTLHFLQRGHDCF